MSHSQDFVATLGSTPHCKTALNEALTLADTLFEVTAKVGPHPPTEINLSQAESIQCPQGSGNLDTCTSSDNHCKGTGLVLQWINVRGKDPAAVKAAQEYILACVDTSTPNFVAKTVNVDSCLTKLLTEDGNLFRRCLERKFRVCVRLEENCTIKLSGDELAVVSAESALHDLSQRLATKDDVQTAKAAELRRSFIVSLMSIDTSYHWAEYNKLPGHIIIALCRWLNWYLGKDDEDEGMLDSPVVFDSAEGTEWTDKDISKRKWQDQNSREEGERDDDSLSTSASLETLDLNPASTTINLDDSDDIQIVALLKPSENEDSRSLQQPTRRVRKVPGNEAKKFAMSNSPRSHSASNHSIRVLSAKKISFYAEGTNSPLPTAPEYATVPSGDSTNHCSSLTDIGAPPAVNFDLNNGVNDEIVSNDLVTEKPEEEELAGERPPHHLLRPVVIDACNVGFVYGKNKKMDCRGIALAAQYFLEKGHLVNAFLPENYSAKSVCINEHILGQLEELDIVSLTQSRKIFDQKTGRFVNINNYDDLQIIEIADKTGGVIISRDHFVDVQRDYPQWRQTISNRVLHPTFAGDVFSIPVDGPLGRHGPNTSQTLTCHVEDMDIPRLVDRQLKKSKQRELLSKLDLIVRGVKPDITQRNVVNRFKTPPRSNLFAGGVKYPPPVHHSTIQSGKSASNLNLCRDEQMRPQFMGSAPILSNVLSSGARRSVEKTEEYKKIMVQDLELSAEKVDMVLRENPEEQNLNDLILICTN